MDRGKFTDKLKEGVSVQELENFARKHTSELLSVLATIIGAISSGYDFFTGPKFSIFFMALGTILAIIFPAPIERALKQLYNFTFKQEKTTELIIGGVKIIIAIFLPFLYFGLMGLLAGTSYHYYIRHAQIMSENKAPQARRPSSGEEHD
ncbi:MAG: hypothetical protein HY069_02590 [Chlamydiia bacterium]|nr:hypothetical protein [Chlamydiia bacterium]